jgi:excisionase family DNA binding protein
MLTNSADADDLLTVEDLSVTLKVPVTTVYAWRHKGHGPPAIKVGRYLRYRRRDVDRWLDERTTA